MLLDNIYIDREINDWVKYRWSLCEQRHKDSWSVPNAFLETLFTYKNDIKDLNKIETFIETGTYEGWTVDVVAKHFKQVYTIENKPEFIDPTIRTNNPNINFYTDTSVKGLQNISSKIKGTRCVILLDAHDEYNSPIVEELKIIKQFYNKQSVILVDDTCDLGQGTWPTKELFEALILNINSEYNIIYTDTGRGICLIY
jgi:hypothetical protein